MKVVALVSGGKDSCYAMMQCLRYGHDVVALANLLPVDDSVDELDSYMYQTVGHQIVVSYAKCMGLPLFRRRLQGSTRHHALSYRMTPGDEVEDMFMLLSEVKRQIPSVTAVCSGAIASDYQRLRVESVCSRLGLVSLAYLWKQDQSLLLEEMITSGIIAIIVKVAAIGLNPSKHLGRELAYMKPHLHHLNGLYGINVCGEGGEYESLTLDCPLFKFAQIVLDDFQVVLHSSDSIAPVGVLHPVAFHLEPKELTTSRGNDLNKDISIEERVSVHEVEGDCTVIPTNQRQCSDVSSELSENTTYNVKMSKTDRGSTFSICCWLPEVCRSFTGLQADMKVVLTSVESHLKQLGFGWENVFYVHLYISNMNEFSVVNETYVSFITQEKCKFGVPSRSTIELPLSEAGLGKAYIEVLVSRDQTRKVLHVQSISCWAPSCIGPYSQATLHHGVLHMAGQLGLDPPTMALTSGGPTAELEQALLNSEAVAKCFNCSISTCAISITVYCSQRLISLNRTEVQEKWESFLKQLKDKHLANGSNIAVLNPVVLFVFVPELPKRALVEVKPLLLAITDVESETCPDIQDQSFTTQETLWGFQPEQWHNSCIQKCILPGNICAVAINITGANIATICWDSSLPNEDGGTYLYSVSESDAEKIAKFCIYLVNGILLENGFSWQDAMYLRFYYQTDTFGSMEKLALILSSAFQEFAIINPKLSSTSEPVFNLVPVLGSGRSVTRVESVLTCELLVQKPLN